jgi:3-isopropylmalate dehydrogenase
MDASIAILPGDGVGPEVISESMKVLDAVASKFKHNFNLTLGDIGGCAIDKYGTALPDITLEKCSNSDAILMGAVGGPKWDDPSNKIRPEDGLLKIRKSLKLFANIRPVKVYPSLLNATPIKPEILKNVDILVIRELTGGLYFGKPKKRWATSKGRRGVDTLKYSEHEIRRILKLAFELSGSRRKKLTSVDKQNVLETSRLWREIAIEMSSDYPEIELEHILVDNAAMQLIRNPSDFDVIVSENTFGDILTDETAVLSGSMGMLPSASLSEASSSSGNGMGLYEPIHGSAPDISGQGIANPIGSILSTAMMLRLSFNLNDEALAIERAVEGILEDGYRTADISMDVAANANTTKIGDLIAGSI